MPTYTPYTARDLANALDSDPIAASQIKEYLSEERLIELLGIELPEPPKPDEPEISDFHDSEIVNAAVHRGLESEVLEDMDSLEIIDELIERGTPLKMIEERFNK